jgi:hypothetical protein
VIDLKAVAGIPISFALSSMLVALVFSGCTGYRTYNSVFWAKEAYKQGMAEVERVQEQAKGINFAYTRRAEAQTRFQGSSFSRRRHASAWRSWLRLRREGVAMMR